MGLVKNATKDALLGLELQWRGDRDGEVEDGGANANDKTAAAKWDLVIKLFMTRKMENVGASIAVWAGGRSGGGFYREVCERVFSVLEAGAPVTIRVYAVTK